MMARFWLLWWLMRWRALLPAIPQVSDHVLPGDHAVYRILEAQLCKCSFKMQLFETKLKNSTLFAQPLFYFIGIHDAFVAIAFAIRMQTSTDVIHVHHDFYDPCFGFPSSRICSAVSIFAFNRTRISWSSVVMLLAPVSAFQSS